MIVVRNSQLNNETVSALNNLIELDLNAKVAFKLMRIIKEVSSLVDDKIKLEKRIFEKYLEKDENGYPVRVIGEDGQPINGVVKISDVEKFNVEMGDLMGIENSLPFEKINFEDLNLTSIKIKDLIKIDFIFE